MTFEKQADSDIKELYHRLHIMPNISMTERIQWISSRFLEKPYMLGSLGEGSDSSFDQFPEYRTDAFDCETYVNTVLALALGHSLKSFKQCLLHTRYKNGQRTYINRNHFTSVDWNKNNQLHGILKDITLQVKAQDQHSPAVIAETLIDKPSWYAHKTLTSIRLRNKNEIQEQQLLEELKAQGSSLEITLSKLPYIPLTALFQNNKPNMYLFSQIPDGAIIEIVRPNWDLRSLLGTDLDISHMGFALRIQGLLYFRQASSDKHKVVDIPLIDYLEKAQKSPTIKGINIQIVLPKQPFLKEDCKRY